MAPSTSSAPIFSSRPGGLGVTPLSVLAVAAEVTELYKRLLSPGLLGEAARSRWTAFQRILDQPGDIALLSAKQLALHHTGHILRLAWRFGANVTSLSTFKLEYRTLVSDISLEDVMSCLELAGYLDRMRRSPFRTLKDVREYVNLTPSPPLPAKDTRTKLLLPPLNQSTAADVAGLCAADAGVAAPYDHLASNGGGGRPRSSSRGAGLLGTSTYSLAGHPGSPPCPCPRLPLPDIYLSSSSPRCCS
jgi:hypothetical protein